MDHRSVAAWVAASASFIPSKPTRDLRDLVRYRKTLVQERAREVNRLQKVLETANIKVSSVGSLVMGKSGQRMVAAMIEGGSSAEALAELARGTLRRKLPQLQQALHGQVQPHHQLLLGQSFAHMSYLEHSIQHLQLAIDQRLSPFEEAMRLGLGIPGIQALTAAAILAEIGCDLSRFPSAKHLASWAGVCPGNKPAWGQAPLGQDHQRQYTLARRADRSGLEHQSHERQLALGEVTSVSTPAGQTESRHCSGPQLAHHHLSCLV
jgi:transposase